MRSNCDQRVGRYILKLGLPAASIVIPVIGRCAVGHVISTRYVLIKTAVHASVSSRLCRWTVATVIVITLQRHCAWLQRQVQPDKHEQAQGTVSPRLLLLPDIRQMTQMRSSEEVDHDTSLSFRTGYC